MDTTLYQGVIVNIILVTLLWISLKSVNAIKYPRFFVKFSLKDLLIVLIAAGLIFAFNDIFFGTKAPTQDILQVVIVTIIAAPIVEEILFRRIIFEYLLQNTGRRFSIRLVLSALFVAIAMSIALFLGGATAEYFAIVLLLLFLLFFNITKKFCRIYALSIQAIFFGLIHAPSFSWPLLISGLLYGGIYLWKRNILLTILSHSVINILIMAFFY